MARFIVLGVACVLLVVLMEEARAAGSCPLASQVHSCSPTCLQDSDCSYGKRCCSNLCNTKSCAEPTNQGSSSKGGSSGGSGTYCNNVKCNSYEKCELDKSSKRMKCVRA